MQNPLLPSSNEPVAPFEICFLWLFLGSIFFVSTTEHPSYGLTEHRGAGKLAQLMVSYGQRWQEQA